VHITDVSYFVKPNTALDRDARKRATSVYLVQRAVPMLPPTLSEQLCSLVPGQDRLSLSVIFTLTKEAKVVKKWFGKTVIRSSAKLSYENVQDVIEGKILGGVPVAPEHEAADIAHDIKVLHELASELHTQRFEQGALSLDSLRLSFGLNENGFPEDCWQRERTDANQLVEEVGYYFNRHLLYIHHLGAVYASLQYLSRPTHCSAFARTSSSPPT
jgi:protein SSD1